MIATDQSVVHNLQYFLPICLLLLVANQHFNFFVVFSFFLSSLAACRSRCYFRGKLFNCIRRHIFRQIKTHEFVRSVGRVMQMFILDLIVDSGRNMEIVLFLFLAHKLPFDLVVGLFFGSFHNFLDNRICSYEQQ